MKEGKKEGREGGRKGRKKREMQENSDPGTDLARSGGCIIFQRIGTSACQYPFINICFFHPHSLVSTDEFSSSHFLYNATLHLKFWPIK